MLLVPLATGAAVGLVDGGRALPLIPLTLAALALFWLRTPLESWLGTTPLRAQSGPELRLVRRTVAVLAAVSLLALTWLLRVAPLEDLWAIGGGAGLAFVAQAVVKKTWRQGRTAAQMIGAAGLSAVAPAALVAVTGRWAAVATSLWIANWLFSGNQIHFVQLRIHGARASGRAGKFAAGRGFLAGQLVLFALLAGACGLQWFPWSAALAFVQALVRGFGWFAGSSQPLVIRRVGFTELAHSIAFGALLVWGLAGA